MTSLKQVLKNKLTKKELAALVTSYDVVGDIAIIEIPSILKPKEKLVAEAIMQLNKHIKVVCKKVGIHRGIYRRQKLKIITGERRKTTIHRENKVLIKLHLEKVYFSPRLSTERLRIAKQVKPNETVLVMFSGVAPYCLVIAKNASPKVIYGIEINPVAHRFAEENVKLNKLEEKIRLYLGDVRIVVPMLKKKFDRIVMPLPLGGENFLDTALSAIKKGGIIHFYDFKDVTGFEIAKEKVLKACKKARKKCKILRLVKCGQIAPRTYRICIDFKVC